jgi:hypothetical protein
MPRCCHALTTMQSQLRGASDQLTKAGYLLLGDKHCGEIAINALMKFVER